MLGDRVPETHLKLSALPNEIDVLNDAQQFLAA